MTRFTSADVVVVGLIGERGREVGEFVRTVMTDETRKRTIVVAVPANHSPLLRIWGACRATAIAEYFRDQGKDVLLIMDSLTRVAHAQRDWPGFRRAALPQKVIRHQLFRYTATD